MAKPLINITYPQALVFAIFLVAYEFLTYIANDMIMPGMVQVVATFHGSEADIASSLTAYLLGGASLQIFLGPLSDRYGRRPVMMVGAWLFFICTILIGCSNSMEQFLIARFLQGMGLCFISVVGYATIQEIFAEMDAIRLTALMANVSIIAPLLGPLLGALIVIYYSWRFIFVIVAIGSFATIWGLWFFMPESVGVKRNDGVEIQRMPLAPKIIFKNYWSLITNVKFLCGTISLAVVGIPCIVWIAISPVMIIKAAKLSMVEYALWQIPVFGASIIGNMALHRWSYKTSVPKIVQIGTVLAVLSLLFMFILPLVINDYFLWLMPGLIIYFFSLGVVVAPLTRLVLFATHITKGTASAVLCMTAMLGQAFGIEVLNYWYASTHNNLIFGLYCAVTGLIYLIFLFFSKLYYATEKLNFDPGKE